MPEINERIFQRIDGGSISDKYLRLYQAVHTPRCKFLTPTEVGLIKNNVTSTQLGNDLYNDCGSALQIYINVTTAPGAGTGIYPILQAKDSAGNYISMRPPADRILTVSRRCYNFHRGFASTSLFTNGQGEDIGTCVPQFFRVAILHTDALTFSYSVEIIILP